jgi:aminopeptidase N
VIRQNALGLLFPKTLLTRTRLAEFDAWLASAHLNDSVARQVGERRDDAERALHCQEAASS